MSKKLISLLLAVLMIVFTASAFAEYAGPVVRNDAVVRFLDETDLKTKDIALQVQAGDTVQDLVIRIENDHLHLVTRNNGAEAGHIQFTPTGIYVGSADAVTLLRFDTIVTVLQEFVKEVQAQLEEAVKNAPAEQVPSQEEIKAAVDQLTILAAEAAAQEEADAVTLTSAAVAFAGKFKPEYILDVKEESGKVEISLRKEAFASALADAMDELMTNPGLARLVDREAAQQGGATFADAQAEWLKNREAVLEAIRSMESTETIAENGHWTSHFQIGGEAADAKILVCDTDSWIDPEDGEAQVTAALGIKDEDPLLVYELAVSPYSYDEKLTSGNSYTEVNANFAYDRMTGGKVATVIEGKEELKAYFGPDYMYIKGPKGGVSTSVRETWSGKTRYELVAENAQGQSATIYIDFYQEDDRLVFELSSDQDEQSVKFMLSRIDKIDMDELPASKNITEITVEDINQLAELMEKAVPAATDDAGTSK